MLYLPNARTNYDEFNIRFNVAKLWNSIEENLKSKSYSLKKYPKRIDNFQPLTGPVSIFQFPIIYSVCPPHFPETIGLKYSWEYADLPRSISQQ